MENVHRSIKIKEFQRKLKVPAKKIDTLFNEFSNKCKFKEKYGYCTKYTYVPVTNEIGINFCNTVCSYGNCEYTIKIIA